MGTAIEIIDGRTLTFNEGAVNATRVFVLTDYPDERRVLDGAFGSTVTKTGDPSSTVEVPRIEVPHPVFPDILFCHAYNLTQLPGEHNLWRAEFQYRRVNRPALAISSIGTGPADTGFTEVTARVSGSFVEQYRADPLVGADYDFGADIGGDPIDRAGVPTSIMRQQMEITVNVTVEGPLVLQDIAASVGTRTLVTLFGIAPGLLLYRGANIQRIETNKFTLQHTWLFDNQFHLIQEPAMHINGTPQLGKEGDSKYNGKAYPVYYKQPFPFGDSHLLIPNSFQG
tara:strand:- start:3219 stop:4070 length:852 start_codon:yes stop_codon:yes gene_type:complete